MSVAFRRESDEEHLEPRFDRPVPPGPNLVTARGLSLIAARVAELELLLRTSGEDDGKTAATRDLRYWRKRLASAEVVAPRPSEEAIFGSRVTIRMGGATRTLTIVGHDEADGAPGRIGHAAPLARALLGAAAGDEVQLGRETIEVLAVEMGED